MTRTISRKPRFLGLLVAALCFAGCASDPGDGGSGAWRSAKMSLPPQAETKNPNVDPNPSVNPFIKAASDPLSTFAADVDTASYDIFRRDIEAGRLPDPETVRSEEFINAFTYAYPAPDKASKHPFAIHMEAAASGFLPGTKMLRIGIQGRRVDLSKRADANLVFLVDTSGSMSAPEKLPLVQQLLTASLDVLRPTDKVSIVTYAGNAGVLLGSTPVKSKAAISKKIAQLTSGGGTNGAGGINAAYAQAQAAFIQGGINHVVLCTDGDFNLGLTANQDLVDLIVAKRKGGVTLTALAFGGWSFNDAMMEAVTNAGNGIYAMIDSAKRAHEYAAEELIASMVHIAKDVKIQVEFNPDRVTAYRLIGYENRKIADKDFRNDIVDAGEVGTGHAVTALYELVLNGATIPQPKGAPKPSDGEPYSGKGLTVSGDDLAMVRLRYKQPGAAESDPATEMAVAFPQADMRSSLAKASPDMRWAVSLAGLAELLRGSPYRTKADVPEISALCSGAVGKEPARKAHHGRVTVATTLIK